MATFWFALLFGKHLFFTPLPTISSLIWRLQILSCASLQHCSFFGAGLFPSSEIGKHIFCRLLSSALFMWLSTTSSAVALVLVSLERFIGIVYPLHYHLLITTKRVRIAITCQWIIALIAEVYNAVVLIYDESENGCAFKLYVGFYTFHNIISYVFPVVTLICLYYRMFSSLGTTLTHNERNNLAEARRKQHQRARNNILINLFIVTILFVALWTPCQVIFLLDYYVDTTLNEVIYIIAMYILTLCNSVVNPIVYCFRYRQFQKALRIHVLPCLGLRWLKMSSTVVTKR